LSSGKAAKKERRAARLSWAVDVSVCEQPEATVQYE
jgi:hypothetical protein